MLAGVLYLKYNAYMNAEEVPEIVTKTNATWDEYVSDCGSDVLEKNSLKYSYNFT
jgi:hypothetical protein